MKVHKTPRAKSIIQATVIVATITILCKILGFVEKLLLAYYFGTGVEVDAYIVAFSVPFFSFIVLREVLEPAFVPTFIRVCKERGERGGWKLASVIANALAIGLGAMIIIGLVAAPSLASILAPGFTDEGRALTIKLIRMILPALLFMGLSSLTTAILHAHKRFTLPAVSEAVFRAAPLLFFYALSGLTGLVIGVVIGALGKLTLQTLGLWRRLKSYLPSLDLRYSPVQRVGLLATPLFFGSFLSYLVWPFVDNIFASTLPPGSVSALAFAKKMVETLTLIFPYALGVVIFPFFSELALKTDRQGLSQALTGAMRAMIFICTPITIGLISLRVPIIRLLFERGEFDFASTQLTASPLMYYSLGLIAFSL